MVHYVMLCPIHTDHGMDSIKMVKRSETSKQEPLFECPFCKRYYLYDTGTEGKKIGTYGDRDVIATRSKYKLYSDTFGKSGSIWKDDKHNKTAGWKPDTIPVSPGSSTDNTVRIKRIKDEEVSKPKNNLSNLRNEYPSIATDKMSVFDFMLKVFGSNVERACVVRNTSLKWKGSFVKKVEFYVTDSQYLKTRVPENIYISFGGKLSNGEFVVDEIRVLDNPSISGGWMSQKLKFAYDGAQHLNWFYGITNVVAEPSKKLTGELASWNDYLDWKRQLAELRIRGIKYIAFKIDFDERKMTFLSVSEGAAQSKEFRRFINRNDVSVFSNRYSKNRWSFEFNRDYQDNQDSGVDVIFMEYGEHFDGTDAVRESWWRYVDPVGKKYKDEGTVSFSQKVSSIAQNYFEPYFQEIVFELTERALTLIRRDIRRNGSVSSSTEQAIAEEFFSDGYLATSQIGDFALLSRLQRAIDDLSNGKSAQQALSEWLFDITKANNPQNTESVTIWQNRNINDKQKQAVEKIISAPEVCLIQGPPGTGKTTVIAEAIYQLVIRNKRILVASQANLAVDNALERLISNPKIRAIRLGNTKKIDDSVRNITEENVLETFYSSIVEYIDRRYLKKWRDSDSLDDVIAKEYQEFQELRQQARQVESTIAKKTGECKEIERELESPETLLLQKKLVSERMSAMMISSYSQSKSESVDLMLGEKRIITLWMEMEPLIFVISQNGISLTKVGIDTKNLDNPIKLIQANRIIKFILVNTRKALQISERIKADTKFGGETEEIENLKLLEIELREKLMSDPSVVTEWQAVNKKIKELSLSGFNLGKEEIALFDGIETIQEDKRSDYLKDVFRKTETDLEQLNDIIFHFSEKSLIDIDVEIQESEKHVDDLGKEKEEKYKEIESLKQKLSAYRERQNLILKKYEASSENLSVKMDEYRSTRMKQLQTNLSRGEWEEIFTGLTEWVDGIPDYSQEKDIFLREFINGCNVVGVSCTENTRTLTENGFDDFDVVIIDEVSKATPPELLIPMLRGRKIVLVGDHRQLPPLFNEHEKSYEEVAKQQEDNEDMIVPLTMEDFEKYKDMVTASLFERYFESADPSIKETLTIQYRMHSDIMDLINLFYDGKLSDGNEDEYTEDTKAHYLNIYSTFGTEMIVPEKHAYWFDSSQLAGERIFEYRKPQSSSCENRVEAETIIELLRKMENQYANMAKFKEPVSVGVISFYFDQVSLIRKLIKQESFHAIDVEVNTVDRFQGKEKEVIFVSLVRNVKNPKHNLDSYIAAFQRINVAFSRAQHLLVILGATDMYSEQPVMITDMNNGKEKIIYPYKQILEMMNMRGTYFTCDEVIPEERVDEILLSIAKQGEDEK